MRWLSMWSYTVGVRMLKFTKVMLWHVISRESSHFVNKADMMAMGKTKENLQS